MEIFQTQSSQVKERLSKSDNIKVAEDHEQPSNLCVIYFSSNELYYPNTTIAFRNAIIERDKFEWNNNKYPGARLHIFVRDLQKQWYIEGVSDRINTPDLLLEKLIELSRGMIVYTIGSSAGGFAALLFGSRIKAQRVYAFNAQLNLFNIMKGSDPLRDPLLFKHRNNSDLDKFYEISNYLRPDTEYYYFQSANSKMDIEQFRACRSNSLLTKIEFSTSNHGFPFLRHDLGYVLKLTSDELKSLSHRRLRPFLFSVEIHGVIKASWLTFDKIKKRIVKKITEKMEG